jgi:hypothetical protein
LFTRAHPADLANMPMTALYVVTSFHPTLTAVLLIEMPAMSD